MVVGRKKKKEEGVVRRRREYLHLTEMASSSCRLGQEGRLSSCN